MNTLQPARLPHQYPRRILLAVSGLSPQIITETLYALTQTTQPAFIPTEVHIITTLEGRKRIRENLLSEQTGWFHRLCEDYQLPAIAFSDANIHVLETDAGQQLKDIRSVDDNEQTANFITEQVRSLASDQNASLHVSIAGGRKTMGFYMGYALSLYGRAQDRLSHVLVSTPYESLPSFYYPTPTTQVIYTRDDKPLDAAQAEVILAEIPFVRLREGLPKNLLEGQTSFNETVQIAQQQLTPSIHIHLEQGKIQCGNQQIKLKSVDFVFYLWLLQRRLDGLTPVRWSDDGVNKEFLHLYERYGSNGSRTETALKDEMSKEYFDERKSRVNTALRKKLGEHGAHPYLIHGTGKRPETRYGVEQIEPSAIKIEK